MHFYYNGEGHATILFTCSTKTQVKVLVFFFTIKSYIIILLLRSVCIIYFAATHYDMFPKSLGEVIDKYNVHELHLTLTQGFWRHRSWGYTLHDASPGAELWVWFNENTFE